MLKQKDTSILFIPTSHDPSLGSHRIWVLDLCHYLEKIGVNCKIGRPKYIENYDIVIYGKGAQAQASQAKKTLKSCCWHKPKHKYIKYTYDSN